MKVFLCKQVPPYNRYIWVTDLFLMKTFAAYCRYTCFILLSFFSGKALAQSPKPGLPVFSFLKEQDFNKLFPLRDHFYSYEAFKTAVSKLSAIDIKIERRGDWFYRIWRTDTATGQTTLIRADKEWAEKWVQEKPYTVTTIHFKDFCAGQAMNLNKREMAAFLANIAHETRNGQNNEYQDGLMLKKEAQTDSAYTRKSITYPAVEGQKYYGRGPMQLSYNTNYGYASACIFGDPSVLLNNPNLLSSNATVAFESAIFFWMIPQNPKPSPHEVITGNWKPTQADELKGYNHTFAMVINIVNGAVECGKTGRQEAMKDRIGFYNYFLRYFGVKDLSSSLGCELMVPYAS